MNSRVEEKPLVLQKKLKKNQKNKSKNDQNLSPAVRKIVTENKIDISSVKALEKMEEF